MSDSENESGSYKIVLKGSDNFADWQLSVTLTLLGKNIIDCIQSERPKLVTAATSGEKKDFQRWGKAYAILIQSLSMVIRSSLSSLASNPMLLYDELVIQYSAMSGSRKAALLQDMKVSEGEDPNPHMGKIRCAQAQINAGGMSFNDEMLAYAMAMALPESYATCQKYGLYGAFNHFFI